MRYAARSDRGSVRENNEDFVLADAERAIFVLADGMGGLPGGEVASRVAAEAAHRVLRERFSGTPDWEVPRLLADGFAAAHSAVFKTGLEEPELAGLGTTLDVVVFRAQVAWLCHVGDGRMYVVGNEGVQQLSIDDNYASALAQKGVREELIPGWARHVLTQAVGVSEELYPEIRQREFAKGEVLLICSDGVTSTLSDALLRAVVRDFKDDLDRAAEEIITAANNAGGSDNASVILVAPEPEVFLPRISVPLVH